MSIEQIACATAIVASSIAWMLVVCFSVYERTKISNAERVAPLMREAARARAKEKHNVR